jgi:FKBP-type peptidyl-prolyl cis-trans isomerase
MFRFPLVLAIGLGFILVAIAQAQNNLPAGGPTNRPSGAAEAAPAGAANGAAQDAEFRAQVGYALGRNFVMQLKENQIECDVNALMAGINDALRGTAPKWTDEQLEVAMQRFAKEMQQRAMMRMQQEVAQNKQAEVAFLAQNGKREGVQSTPSGLQYRVVQQGQGPSPTLNDRVKCNYKGTLLDGTEFDSSARHGGPAEFGVKEVIPGWTESLQKMHVGDKWQLFVPAKLAYGMNPPGPPIEAGSMLVFEIELLEVVKQ